MYRIQRGLAGTGGVGRDSQGSVHTFEHVLYQNRTSGYVLLYFELFIVRGNKFDGGHG